MWEVGKYLNAAQEPLYYTGWGIGSYITDVLRTPHSLAGVIIALQAYIGGCIINAVRGIYNVKIWQEVNEGF